MGSTSRSNSSPIRQPFSACSEPCSPCCHKDGHSNTDGHLHNQQSSCCYCGEDEFYDVEKIVKKPESSNITQRFEDRSRAKQLSSNVDRKWIPVTAYQPIDLITKTIEVPYVKKIQKMVPKIIVEEKIVEVPKIIQKYVEEIVEVPELKTIEKIVEVEEKRFHTKYIPKIETQEKIVYKPIIIDKVVEKIVEVPIVQEVIRYKDINVPEEIIQYIQEGDELPWDKIYENYMNDKNSNPNFKSQCTGLSSQLKYGTVQAKSQSAAQVSTYFPSQQQSMTHKEQSTSLFSPYSSKQDSTQYQSHFESQTRSQPLPSYKSIPQSSYHSYLPPKTTQTYAYSKPYNQFGESGLKSFPVPKYQSPQKQINKGNFQRNRKCPSRCDMSIFQEIKDYCTGFTPRF